MLFAGRRLVIATMHSKQTVIGPMLEDFIQVKTCLPSGFNSDQFGTFSGEIDRTDNPVETARKKCELAMELTASDLAVASEGSFGPHPEFSFIHVNEEIIVLIDKKNNFELVAREIATETNFNGAWIENLTDLKDFAEKANFPSHGLIFRDSKNGVKSVHKGLIDSLELVQLFNCYKSQYGGVFVETDMRANFNPTRMEVIKKASIKLAALLNSKCPHCQTIGFEVTSNQLGLPCALCGCPTKSVLAQVSQCKKCQHEESKVFPKNKTTEDPMYCDRCNP